MKIEGYKALSEKHETDEFHVMISDEVYDFLKENSNGRSRKNVTKVALTLKNIGRNGLKGVANTTLFVREGKFPSGKPGKPDVAVYAAKSDQVRIYGGLITVRGEKVFLCTEGAIKKRDKADQAQLKRVGKTLGDHNE